jgi:hypothetical protein
LLPPTALVLSIVGLFISEARPQAIRAFLLSAAFLAYFVFRVVVANG